MRVREYFDDNANSGVVYYIFETDEELIFAFRGSEAFDDIRHETGWQDWMDNFRMFLKGTNVSTNLYTSLFAYDTNHKAILSVRSLQKEGILPYIVH